MLFRTGTEKFLLVFIVENKDTVPQHVFYERYRIGRGTVTNTARYFEQLGIIERVKCWSEYKQDKVLCYKLTDKGRKIVECLRRIYEIVGLKPALPLLAGDSGES